MPYEHDVVDVQVGIQLADTLKKRADWDFVNSHMLRDGFLLLIWKRT